MSGLSGLLGGRRGGAISLALAVAVVGIALVAFALTHQESAPAPHTAGRIDPPAPSVGPATAVPIGPSPPARIRIPAIGVDSPVNPIGLDPTGALAVPQPGPHLNEAAWFRTSPTPGQPGPSIIEGHVDSVEGPSVFFKLGALRPGDRIRIDRRDGIELTFRVDAVRDYLKSAFPTEVVYGGDLSTPQLRLITCSDFDPSIRHHVGNEVVFSRLVRVTHPEG